jgi:M6 family metalloprotease-like protein
MAMKRVLAIFLAILLPLAGEQGAGAQNEHKALIVPIRFNDLQLITPHEKLDSLATELSKYYEAQFRDSIKFVFDVYREVMVNGSYTTFGSNQSFRRDALAYKMALTVYKTLYDQMDVAIYDNDNDGCIELVCVIFAGYSQNQQGGNSTIWAKASYQNVKLNDNLRISRFNCSSELFHPSEKYSNYINGTGVLCVGTGNDGVDRDRGTEADSRWPTSDSRPATAG